MSSPSPLAARSQLVEGDFVFTAEDFRRIAAILYADAGISLADSKATLVYSRLAKRLRALGLASFSDYCRLVAGRDGLDERQNMLTALTTNVTRFFREPHHFDHLAAKVLPGLAARARAGERIRLWSAGCASGPEAYSIAMTVLGALPEAAELDVRILATDIDVNVLAEGRRGVYSDHALTPSAPEMKRRWFEPERREEGLAWRAGETLRALVAFRELNLVAPPWPMKGGFDVIFCRNVLIYFDDETQRGVVDSLAKRLRPGGWLYLGHSERVGSERSDLTSEGLTIYHARAAA